MTLKTEEEIKKRIDHWKKVAEEKRGSWTFDDLEARMIIIELEWVLSGV